MRPRIDRLHQTDHIGRVSATIACIASTPGAAASEERAFRMHPWRGQSSAAVPAVCGLTVDPVGHQPQMDP